MSDLINSMGSISSGTVNLINASLAIASFLIAFISIIFVVLTIRQNNKMIENATRPVITIYISRIELSSKLGYYIIIKNAGPSPAQILSFSSDKDLADLAFSKTAIPFSGIVNSTLAPGQSITSAYDYDKAIKMKDINISVSYASGVKTYNSVTYVNFNQFHGNTDIGVPENLKYKVPQSMAEQELRNLSNLIHSFLINNL